VSSQATGPTANAAGVGEQVRSGYWKARYYRWRRPGPTRPGYSLLVPVPGDLPVFTELALAVCRLQDPTGRRETLVIPDLDSPEVDRAVAAAAPTWEGALRVQRLGPIERVVLPRLRDPGKNHGAQIIAGVTASTGTHVILHDADLFPRSERLHADLYGDAIDGELAAVGVDEAWDPWFAEHDLHLVATWEMCARVGWLRSFRPGSLFAHRAQVAGQLHLVDTTFFAQTRTDPARLCVRRSGGEVAHFNYVISTYRRFQNHLAGAGGPFADSNLRLLLVRMFIDLFDTTTTRYVVPPLQTLQDGLGDRGAPVRYTSVNPGVYRAFRDKVDAILQGGWIAPDRRHRAVGYLDVFDRHFGRDTDGRDPSFTAAATGR